MMSSAYIVQFDARLSFVRECNDQINLKLFSLSLLAVLSFFIKHNKDFAYICNTIIVLLFYNSFAWNSSQWNLEPLCLFKI